MGERGPLRLPQRQQATHSSRPRSVLVKSICDGGQLGTALPGPGNTIVSPEPAHGRTGDARVIQIQEWAQLSRSEREQVAALLWSEGDSPAYSARLNGYPRTGPRFQNYRAWVAVDRGRVLGHVGTIRTRFRTTRGSREVCGISDVVVRPDATRRGIATGILQHALTQAQNEGLTWSMLWTRRSWGAHRAYEKLGFRDIYSPTTAVRAPSERAPPRSSRTGVRLRSVRRSDLPWMEGCLARATHGRLGFVPRDANSFRDRTALGWWALTDYRILVSRRTDLGYLIAPVDRWNVLVREAVVSSPRSRSRMLDALGALAGDRWVGVATTTFTRDSAREMRDRGYRLLPSHHAVLMACPLDRTAGRELPLLRATTTDKRFSCHRGDMF